MTHVECCSKNCVDVGGGIAHCAARPDPNKPENAKKTDNKTKANPSSANEMKKATQAQSTTQKAAAPRVTVETVKAPAKVKWTPAEKKKLKAFVSKVESRKLKEGIKGKPPLNVEEEKELKTILEEVKQRYIKQTSKPIEFVGTVDVAHQRASEGQFEEAEQETRGAEEGEKTEAITERDAADSKMDFPGSTLFEPIHREKRSAHQWGKKTRRLQVRPA